MDDVPLSGATRGWVTTLVGNLETVVRQRLSKEFEIWTDHELAGNKPLTAAIMEGLEHTAALMVVMSPAYLASDWCRRERVAFLELIKVRRTRSGPVFILHYDKVDRSGVPPEFGDLIGHSFWVEEERGTAPRTLGIPLEEFLELEPKELDLQGAEPNSLPRKAQADRSPRPRGSRETKDATPQTRYRSNRGTAENGRG
jgi:TIR domain